MKYNKEFVKDGILDYTNYAEFFADNIQYAEEYDEGKKVYEGLSYDDFLVSWNKDIEKNVNEIVEFLRIKEHDEEGEKRLKTLCSYQEELSKIGINIDFANLFFLCIFIMRIIKSGYIALLKPTPNEIVYFSKDIEKITFSYSDGSIAETNSQIILAPIKKALDIIADTNDSIYEVEKLVEISEISNQEIFQVKFVYYLSLFLKKQFPNAKRRANCVISKTEQSLTLYLLHFFKLSNYELSLYRYRQLWMYSKSIKERMIYSYIEGEGLLPISFVKFEDWKGKKLSYIEETGTPYKMKLTQLKVGDTIVFSRVTKFPNITVKHK